MLTVTNLSIRTKQTKETLVRSVSFSVKNGEALGLIGESGSGKSMTSKCIMRLLNPRLFDLRGSVQWNGKEMLAMKLNELDGYEKVLFSSADRRYECYASCRLWKHRKRFKFRFFLNAVCRRGGAVHYHCAKR